MLRLIGDAIDLIVIAPGLIMAFNLAIGLYSPTVGGTLFVAARIGNVRIAAIS